MANWVPLLIALISLAGTGFTVWLNYRSSRQKNQVETKLAGIEDRKVDQTSYDRVVEYYDKIVTQLNEQIQRLTLQVKDMNADLDRVYTQLSTERDVSNGLRNQLWGLQNQVRSMERTIEELTGQLTRVKTNAPDPF